MADVNISKFRASVVRDGSKPASPGFVVSEGQDPVNPPGTNNYVPYSGATANVELGEFGVEAGFITLDTTPTNTPTDQGTIFWDADDETVDIVLNGYTMKIGEDLFYPVKNQTGSTIAKGTAVRFNGTLGASGRLLIAPFIADGSVPSSRFMGVTAEEILNGEDGKVLYFGRIRGINTNAFNEGDILYASTTVAGGYQTAIPVAPNNIVQVAAVVTKHVNNGTIFVRPTLGSNLNTDEAVKLTSVADKNLLQYQSGTALWENKSLTQVLGGTSSQFVKGDGSLDSTAYGTGTVTSVGLSSATSGVTIGSTPVTSSGTITLAIATASGSQNGLLSSTDWTTFNGKQNALTNPVTGTGTTNFLPKFTGTSTIGNSAITDVSGIITIGTTASTTYGTLNIVQQSVAAPSFVRGIELVHPNGTGVTGGYLGISVSGQKQGQIQVGDDAAVGDLIINPAGGNLGLGVTPSAWGITPALQVTLASIYNQGDDGTYITSNGYYNAGWKYIGASTATQYQMFSGQHRWFTAPSGTAGNAISFTQAMTLFNTGNLLVGTPSPISDNGARLQVSGTATIGTTSNGGNVNTFVSSYGNNGLFQSFGTDGALKLQMGGLGTNEAFFYTGPSNKLTFYSGGAVALTIASTGAATFSSSVTATNGLFNSGTNQNTIGSGSLSLINFSAYNSSANQSITLGLALDTAVNNNIAYNYLLNVGGDATAQTLTLSSRRRGIADLTILTVNGTSGNVGIGTTNPSAKLQVIGNEIVLDDGTNGRITFGASNVSVNRIISTTTGFGAYRPMDYWATEHRFLSDATTELMRITSGGNVLIGTPTSGASKLRVVGLPTSSSGLSSGDVWSDSGTLKIA
jgi:hypothetical protein